MESSNGDDHDESQDNSERPGKRRRVPLACDNCRERKIRCDGAKPICTACRSKKRSKTCAYHVLSESEKAQSERAYVQSLQNQISQLEEQANQRHGGHSNSAHSTPSNAISPRASRSAARKASESGSGLPLLQQDDNSPVTAMGTAVPSTMLGDSPNATEQFYGQSSVLSVMQQIRGPNATRASPQTAKTPTKSSTSGQAAGNTLNSTSLLHDQYSLPPRRLADALIDVFWNEVHFLYPWVHVDSFMAYYNSIWSSDDQREQNQESLPNVGLGGANCSTSIFFCALNAILATACQFSDMNPQERNSSSTTFYQRARTLLNANLLDGGSLAQVQALLLIAQYLQCTRSPSPCWNVVGMACRMCVGLGLHRDDDSDSTDSLKREMRRRVWHSCLQMDLTISMTMGRPVLSHVTHNVPLPLAIDDEYLSPTRKDSRQPDDLPSRNQFLVENLKLSGILDQILSSVYATGAPREAGPNVEDILCLDGMLHNFKESLHPVMRWEGRPSQPNNNLNVLFTRQSGTLYIRYLHHRVLLHRPVLSHLCATRKANSLQNLPSPSDFTTKCQSESAAICVEAACNLVDAIHQGTSGEMKGAWWYGVFYLVSAAVVLILGEPYPDLVAHLEEGAINKAWEKCEQALFRMVTLEDSFARDYCMTLKGLRNQAMNENSKTMVSVPPPPQDASITGMRPLSQSNDVTNSIPMDYQAMGQVPDLANMYEASSNNMMYYNLMSDSWNTGLEDIMLPAQLLQEMSQGQSIPGFF